MKSLFSYAGGKLHLIRHVEEIYKNSNKSAFIDVFGESVRVLMNIDYFTTSFLILSLQSFYQFPVSFSSDSSDIGCFSMVSFTCPNSEKPISSSVVFFVSLKPFFTQYPGTCTYLVPKPYLLLVVYGLTQW